MTTTLPQGQSLPELVDLRKSALAGICLIAVVVAFCWAAGSALWAEIVNDRSLVVAPVILFSLALVAWLGDKLSFGLRSAILLLGLTCAFAPILSARDSVAWLFLTCVPVTVAGLVVGTRSAIGLAAGLSALLVAAVRLGWLPYTLTDLTAPISVLWITVVTGWFAARSLYTALGWALESQRLAWEAARDARNRREALRRAVDSLNTTHGMLEQSLAELSAARIESERAKQLRTEFAANISHELRTPLNIILGFTEIMTRSPEVYGAFAWPDKLHRDVFEVRRNARYLSEFVDDILDLARLDAMRMPINRRLAELQPIIANSLELVERLVQGKPVRLLTDIPADLPAIPLDETRIRQVLLNLLINACRFTERGSITVSARASDSEVLVTVADTGPGIPQDRLERIFDKFEQAGAWQVPEATGKGLGLALAKELVSLHGGRIWAESAPDAGSQFHFALPLGQTNIGRLTQVRATRPAPEEAVPTVLVVDEDDLSTKYLQRQLEGYRVVGAVQPGNTARRVAQEHPRCVIVNTPPGRPCPDPTLLPDLEHVPLIACSLPSWRWLVESQQIAAYLAKPVSSETLLATVNQVAPTGEVLVVDDDPGFVQFVRRSLEVDGRRERVSAAFDGKEALRKAREVMPAVMLLDLILPEMDGFAVVEALRQDVELAHIPVVLLSGARLTSEVTSQRGQHLHMIQPAGFSEEQLTQMLRSALLIAAPAYPLSAHNGRAPRASRNG